MSALDELIAAAVASPDDDGPRLVWADAVAGERGELVAVQCALVRAEMTRDIAVDRRRRERELLDAHGTEWSGLADLASGWQFRRGFVEAVRVDAQVFAERGEELFRIAPLLWRIQLDGLADSEEEILRRLDAVIASPAFARVRGLRMVALGRWVDTDSDTHPRDFEAAGSAVVARLIERNALAGLRTLGITRSGLGGSAVAAIASCPDARALTGLHLGGQEIDRYVGLDSTDVPKILASPYLENLEDLDVSDALGRAPMYGGQTRAERAQAARAAADGDAALLRDPRILRLRKLAIAGSRFSDAMIDALATAPFERLEELDISRNDVFAEDFEKLGAAPGLAKLTDLVFDGPCTRTFSAEAATAIGNAKRFDALRRLSIANAYMEPDAAQILLDSPLAQRLETIDLSRNANLVARANDWRRRFGGILLLGDER